MESNSSGRRNISFMVLQARLIRFINLRVQSGDFTERGLARIVGISQSQIHNVLKGARKLKPELADHIMSRLNMGLLDLVESSELVGYIFSRSQGSVEPGANAPAARTNDLHRIGKNPPDRSS